MDASVVVYVVVGVTAMLLALVLAPWRLRRDALDEDEYYAVLSGEAPGDEIDETDETGR